MNHVILSGRLTTDPEIHQGQGDASMKTARYTLAVDRMTRGREGEQNADFIRCVTFGKSAEFAETYLHKGMKIMVEGRINTGSYQNSEGQRVFTTDVIVNSHEFCESKASGDQAQQQRPAQQRQSGQRSGGGYAGGSYTQGGHSYGRGSDFVQVPDTGAEELPWN